MSELNKLILYSGSDIQTIGTYLDNLDSQKRIEMVRSLKKSSMQALWELAEGTKVVLEDMVPSDKAPLEQVIHYGINSLPAFRTFEKRFCRPSGESGKKELWGYNEGATRIVVGPGYYVCHLSKGNSRGNAVVDYYMTPAGKSPGWPKIKSSSQGITGVVFGFMQDFLRKVSKHVTIGRAYKHHLETGNYFALCREEP